MITKFGHIEVKLNHFIVKIMFFTKSFNFKFVKKTHPVIKKYILNLYV